MRDELADKERAFDAAFLPLFRSRRKGVNDGVRSDEEDGSGKRFMPGEYGKVQLGFGAGRRRGKGVEEGGGVEVAFIVGGLPSMGLRWAQFGFAGGHIGDDNDKIYARARANDEELSFFNRERFVVILPSWCVEGKRTT